jgi:hypothetical protein
MKVIAHIPADWLIDRIGFPKDSKITKVQLTKHEGGTIEVTIVSPSLAFDPEAKGIMGTYDDEVSRNLWNRGEPPP